MLWWGYHCAGSSVYTLCLVYCHMLTLALLCFRFVIVMCHSGLWASWKLIFNPVCNLAKCYCELLPRMVLHNPTVALFTSRYSQIDDITTHEFLFGRCATAACISFSDPTDAYCKFLTCLVFLLGMQPASLHGMSHFRPDCTCWFFSERFLR